MQSLHPESVGPMLCTTCNLLPGLSKPDVLGAVWQENLDRIKACYDAAKDPSKPTVTKHHEQVSLVFANSVQGICSPEL